jgi:Response regulator containing CheY-like receiver, AAA-type ATPase, and DNA-binding domains
MKKIILLIDDDQDEFEFYHAALHEINYPGNLIHASSAAQALTILCNLTPDFIFVDYNMPYMNGLKCLEEIKKMPPLQQVPVILSSSVINDDMTQKAMTLGASFCIRKSSKVQALAEILKNIFSMHTRFSNLYSLLAPN